MVYAGNILYDKSLFEADKKLIIFGAGICGRKVLTYLDRNGVKDNVVCFCDSFIKTKKDVAGIPVLNVTDACEQYPDLEYLICGKYEREMYDILRKKSIRKIHILTL
ncbi:MAG: hypothetical protein K1W27_04515 [Lachnospiraceae bacterium]